MNNLVNPSGKAKRVGAQSEVWMSSHEQATIGEQVEVTDRQGVVINVAEVVNIHQTELGEVAVIKIVA